MGNFFEEYKSRLLEAVKSINSAEMDQLVDILDDINSKNGRIYVIGNGGSAATSMHMVNDLDTGLRRRDLNAFDMVSLSDNISSVTALGNDVGFENIFYYQLKNKIRKNDLLVVISCSGNSNNLIKAVNYALENGVYVVGITGFDGGKLKEITNLSIHINSNKGEYALVEDLHMILSHMLYSYYLNRKEESGK